MARPLRVEFAGAIYHVTSWGNAREEILDDDEDRKAFLESLGKVVNSRKELTHWLRLERWVPSKQYQSNAF